MKTLIHVALAVFGINTFAYAETEASASRQQLVFYVSAKDDSKLQNRCSEANGELVKLLASVTTRQKVTTKSALGRVAPPHIAKDLSVGVCRVVLELEGQASRTVSFTVADSSSIMLGDVCAAVYEREIAGLLHTAGVVTPEQGEQSFRLTSSIVEKLPVNHEQHIGICHVEATVQPRK